jgi:hypothetical protein
MRRIILLWVTAGLALACPAQDFRVPPVVKAGSGTSLPTTGSGTATFYLYGPDLSLKRSVQLGSSIELQPSEIRTAGRYVAAVCSESCKSEAFFVVAGDAAGLTFLAHPSRVPVAQSDAISGVVFVFDRFHNLVSTPVPINFQMNAGGGVLMSRTVPSQNGVAWLRANSGSRAGVVQLLASINDVSVRRVVQQVASDPCNLRVAAQSGPKGITAETQPIRDCTGNLVPDGTIVTFTATGPEGKSTVDAPTRQGIARAELISPAPLTISTASGVVMGNEIRVGAR